MDRIIGVPGDIVYFDDVLPQTDELPADAYHVTAKIKELHRRKIDGSGVTVAVNDTGESTHPFLPKPVASRDFTGSSSGTRDRHGHGSHCCGIVISLAPKANLIVAKVLSDGGSGSTSGINAGRVWAAKEGADLISESLGDGGGPEIPSDLAAYDQAYQNGASLCNAALGNAGFNGRTNTVGRPGSYTRHCHGIGALKQDWKTRAEFSSGGPASRFCFPGERILSCRPTGGWTFMSGTSMATPGKTGIDALVISWRRALGYPDLKGPQEWEDFYVKGGFVKDLNTPGRDQATGFGIIDHEKLFDTMLDTTRA